MENKLQSQALEALEAPLFRRVRRLVSPGARLLVAVSGGVDSTALTLALARLSGRLGVAVAAAHVDHGARADSARDEAHCRALCEGRRIPYFTSRLAGLAPPAEASGFEARAREARYGALEALRSANGFDWVATGHTASDQAETVLMRLGRGAALGGAAGILSVRGDRLLRPLLSSARADTQAYVQALGVACLSDPMNDDPQHLRVRVRTQLVPTVEAVLGAGATRAFARFAELAAEDDALLERHAQSAWGRCRLEDGAFDVCALVALEPPIGRRVLARWLVSAGLAPDAEAVEAMRLALRTGGRATLPGNRLLVCHQGRATLEASPPRTADRPDG